MRYDLLRQANLVQPRSVLPQAGCARRYAAAQNPCSPAARAYQNKKRGLIASLFYLTLLH